MRRMLMPTVCRRPSCDLSHTASVWMSFGDAQPVAVLQEGDEVLSGQAQHVAKLGRRVDAVTRGTPEGRHQAGDRLPIVPAVRFDGDDAGLSLEKPEEGWNVRSEPRRELRTRWWLGAGCRQLGRQLVP